MRIRARRQLRSRRASAVHHAKPARQAEAAEKLTREKLEEQSYFQLINLAAREMEDQRPAAALRFLDQCPPREDKWEWDYLVVTATALVAVVEPVRASISNKEKMRYQIESTPASI